MISPEDVWETLDDLALERGLTPSGLARAAGLDPTTFNPSRRRTASGEMRWMAMPSLLQALGSLKISPALFFRRLEGVGRGVEGVTVRRIRGLPLSRLSGEGLFDASGHPTGSLWDEMTLPCSVAPGAYAVRVDTDALEPLLREGSSLVLLPDAPPRRSDRVLLLRSGREPILGTLVETLQRSHARHEDVCAGVRDGRQHEQDWSCEEPEAALSRLQEMDQKPEDTGGVTCWAVQPLAASITAFAGECRGASGQGNAGAARDSAGAVCGMVPVLQSKHGVWLHRIIIGTY